MDLFKLRRARNISEPFKIKNELIKLAKKTIPHNTIGISQYAAAAAILTGSPPLHREGFFLLGQFAITESRRVMEHPAGVGGMPQPQGIAGRFEAWLAKHSDTPGASFLTAMVPFAVKTASGSSLTPSSMS